MKKIVSIVTASMLTISAFAQSKDYVKQEINANDKCVPTFYESLKNKMDFKLGYKDGADAAEWKKTAMEKAKELIIQYDDQTPFDMVVLETEKRDGYTAQKVVFNISEESRVLAYLLVPNGKKNQTFPAALMLHDHGSEFKIGKEKMVMPIGGSKAAIETARIKKNTEYKEALAKLSDEEKAFAEKLRTSDGWAEKYFTKLYPGDELAKRGYVVLSFDALGWGDRSVKNFSTGSQQSLASNLFNMGTSFAGIIAQEDVRAAKFLASLPEVDKTRVACVGFSMGGFRSWQLAALSDDITAGISICWIGTMKDHMVIGDGQLKGNSAFSMLHPTIAKYLDYPDVAGLAAPKPMLFYAGENDPVNPTVGVNKAFEKMHKIWTANGADDKLHTEILPKGEHTFLEAQQKSAYDWLDVQFGNKN